MFSCASELFGSNSWPPAKLLGKPSKPTNRDRQVRLIGTCTM